MNRGRIGKRVAALLLALLMLTAAARAEKLTFPDGLKQIEAEAFKGDKAITSVVLPSSLTTLGERAFMNCSKLKTINIPASVRTLGADCLTGCQSDLLIKTTAGSAAMKYAQNHQIDYQADTKYRALLVGQTYIGSYYFSWDSWLYGPANDIKAMEKGLKNFSGTSYTVTTKTNLGASEIISAIKSTFAGAREQDVSLFYYSGHGNGPQVYQGVNYTGALVGYDSGRITASQLRDALDSIPGRKIVIIDACYSGYLISNSSRGEKVEVSGTAEDFVDSFISTFASSPRKNLMGSEYFVITAASDSESSWEINRRGVFTEAFLKGCGYDYAGGRNTSLNADSNGNNVITLQEAFAYAKKTALSKASQHAQVYPSSCNWFGIFRK